MKVERQLTRLARADVARVIPELYRQTFGRLPTQQAAAWLTALVWAETAQGSLMFNHNWGNVSAKQTDSRPWYLPQWLDPTFQPQSEDTARLMAKLAAEREHHPEAFRAYDSHEAGAQHWWSVLNHRRHIRIIRAAEANDARAFHAAITTPHPIHGGAYCTSRNCKSEAGFRTYRDLKAQAMKLFKDLPPSATGAVHFKKGDPGNATVRLEGVTEHPNNAKLIQGMQAMPGIRGFDISTNPDGTGLGKIDFIAQQPLTISVGDRNEWQTTDGRTVSTEVVQIARGFANNNSRGGRGARLSRGKPESSYGGFVIAYLAAAAVVAVVVVRSKK